MGNVSAIWLPFSQFPPYPSEFSCNGPLHITIVVQVTICFALPAKLQKKRSTEAVVRNFLLWKKKCVFKSLTRKNPAALLTMTFENKRLKRKEMLGKQWRLIDCIMPWGCTKRLVLCYCSLSLYSVDSLTPTGWSQPKCRVKSPL